MRQTGDHGNGPALGETETSHAMPMSRKERQSTGRKLAEISATSFLMILPHRSRPFRGTRSAVVFLAVGAPAPATTNDNRASPSAGPPFQSQRGQAAPDNLRSVSYSAGPVSSNPGPSPLSVSPNAGPSQPIISGRGMDDLRSLQLAFSPFAVAGSSPAGDGARCSGATTGRR